MLTGDSFFHLSGLGEPGALAGLNLCGAGRVVCLIDPVGDVYACPFAIHDRFLAGNIVSDGGFENVWKNAPLFRELREPQSAGACGSCGHYDSCRGGCMAAKFFTGLPLDGPDPNACRVTASPRWLGSATSPRPAATIPAAPARSAGPVPLHCLTRARRATLQRKSGLVMARDTWFETVAIAQQRAKKRLPKSVYSSLISASEKGVTVSDNVEAFSELGFAPHVVGATEKRDLATTVMGQDISLPVLISPTGVQAVDPDGEVAVARAAAARGTAMGLSSFASKPIEDVVAANPKIFFQIYWLGGREAIARTGAARQGRRGRRADRHHGLELLARPRLGQPEDPRADEPGHHAADVARGAHQAALVVELRQDVRPPEPAGAQPGPPRRAGAAVLRTPTASGWGPRRRRGRTSPGCASCGADRSCSRA